MNEKIVIGDCELYHGDSIEILPTLKGNADLVVTDAPYLLTSGGGIPLNGDTRMGGRFNSGEYNNDGNIVKCDIDWPDFMPLIFDALNEGHCYMMANNRHVMGMLNAAEAAGFRFHNLLVWDKSTATPNRWYMKNMEFIGFFFKGKAKFINDCGSKQLICCPQEDYGGHPTTKPVALMEYYIRNSSQPGDVVMDPFLGAGATAIAAIKSGRKFIGIEIEKKWFDVSCERIEEFYRQGKQSELFGG